MARLHRPHVPLDVQCAVALRQNGLDPGERASVLRRFKGAYGKLLDAILVVVASNQHCAVDNLQLDHDPPLGARRKVWHDYIPKANDPDYLVWRDKESHRVKTLVRGEHGQYSDLALIKRERRRNRKQSRPKQKIAARKKPWPKRKFQKRRVK
jgi:hypothetical protein